MRALDDDAAAGAERSLALPPAPDASLTAAPAAMSPAPAVRQNVVAGGDLLMAPTAAESSDYASLDDLVETYQALRQDSTERPSGGAGSAADSSAARYAAQLRAFQARQGDILETVFCKQLAAGVVLTRRRASSRGLDEAIHLVLPATASGPEWISTLLLDCCALQMQIRQSLRGSDRSACLRALFFLMGQALRLLEAEEANHALHPNGSAATVSAPPTQTTANGKRKKKAAATPAQLVPADPDVAVAGADARPADAAATHAHRQRLYAGRLQDLRAVVARSAMRRAQTRYALGMLFGALLLGGVAVALVLQLFLTVSARGELQRVVACAVAGAAGAVVSVLQRLTWRRLHLTDQASAESLLLAGTFRPIIGATLAVAMYLFLAAGLLPLAPPHPDDVRQVAYSLAAFAFVAGFGERFAQDMLSMRHPAAADGDSSSRSPATSSPHAPGAS